MGMVSSVSVTFDTGATYSCSSNKGDFVNLEEKKFPRRLKGMLLLFVFDLQAWKACPNYEAVWVRTGLLL